MTQNNIRKPVVLIVLDGWGWRKEMNDNPIAQANTPFFDEMLGKYPFSLLEASGAEVGLPEGQMGNSEIGHMVIGSGMPIPTDLVRIRGAMDRGEFATNPVIGNLFEHVKKNGSALHLIGLLGSGGVHAHQDHLVGMVRAAKEAGIAKIYIHGFTDGRDTPPQSGADFIQALEGQLEEIGAGKIVSLCGRYFAMDRDKNEDRIEKAEAALFEANGLRADGIVSSYLREQYGKGQKDEHIEPIIFSSGGSCTPINDGDAIFFINFRADRAVQLSRRIMRRCAGKKMAFASMTKYADDVDCPVAFPSFVPPVTLAEEISKAGLTQAHIAETEKYAHATYFFNGGREAPHRGEEHVLVESRKVPTHDLAPEMRAESITDEAIARLEKGVDFLFINYANADMVGHTANHEAVLRAIEFLDIQLTRLCGAISKKNGVACITADHGNAEVSRDPEKSLPHTAHTTNPVPFILTAAKMRLRARGTLADIAPTMIELLELNSPAEMRGKSLIEP